PGRRTGEFRRGGRLGRGTGSIARVARRYFGRRAFLLAAHLADLALGGAPGSREAARVNDGRGWFGAARPTGQLLADLFGPQVCQPALDLDCLRFADETIGVYRVSVFNQLPRPREQVF